MNRKCRFCGTPLEGYETFCPGCGRELTSDSGAGFRPEIDSAEDAYVPSDPVAEGDWFMEAAAPQAERGHGAPRRGFGSAGVQGRPGEDPAAVRRKSGGTETARRERRTGGARQGGDAPLRNSGRSGASGRQGAAGSAGRRNSGTRNSRPAARNAAQLNPKQRMLLLGALAVIAVLLIALSVHLLSGDNSAEPEYDFSAVLDTYFESVRTADADSFISTRPPEYVTYLTTGTGGAYPTQAVYRSETSNRLRERLDGYEAEYGDVRAIRYALTGMNSYIHRCEALSGVLTSWYGFRENEVANAVIVSGTYTVQGSKATGEFEFSDLLLIQIGDAWYFSPDVGSYWRAE